MDKKIIIIKIGSGILLTKRNTIDKFRLAHIADQVFDLKKQRVGVVLVVSGAVAIGANFVDVLQGSLNKQIAAGIGQTHLISIIQSIFNKKGLQVSQLLLTKDLFTKVKLKNQIKKVLEICAFSEIVPVLNENDVVELNSFQGNDFLAERVTQLLSANKLIILSTMQGSVYGVGGGQAKQQVIRALSKINIPVEIVDGKARNVIMGVTI
ncbi:MAG: hypothetical protein AAB546_03635 [Patescibacteria group bacterium]